MSYWSKMSLMLAAIYSHYLSECGVCDCFICLGSCPGAIRWATPLQTRIVIDHHLMQAIYDKHSEILRSLQQCRTALDQPDRSGWSIENLICLADLGEGFCADHPILHPAHILGCQKQILTNDLSPCRHKDYKIWAQHKRVSLHA